MLSGKGSNGYRLPMVSVRYVGGFRSCSGLVAGWHSIRVNEQWRLVFRWHSARAEASDVYLDNHSYR